MRFLDRYFGQEKANLTPVQPVGEENNLGTSRRQFIVALASFLALGACNPGSEEKKDDADGEEIVKPKLTELMGNWKFDVMEVVEETFALGEGQKYFAHYIKDKLSRITGADLSYPKDLQSFTDAYITITRKLNPTLNLDRPEEIVGKKIILPATVLFTPADGKFFRSRVGYEYLRDAAEADGKDIRDESQRERIYKEASNLPVMADSQHYECKNTAKDCKEACAPHAQIVYGRIAKEFFELSGGVKLVYNDLMRDEEAEKDIVKKGLGGTELGSTHITGGSLDQAVIWFVIDGVKVKYSEASDDIQADMDKRLKPLLRKLLREYMDRGEILVMDETHGERPHYHLYFPLNVTPLHPQEIKLDLSPNAKPALAPLKQSIKPLLTREKEGVKYYTFTVPDWTLTRMLDSLCVSSSAETIAAIKKFNNDTDHIAPGDVIWIPVELMKPELRDPSLSIVDDTKGVNEDIITLYNPNYEEGDSYRAPTALLK